MSLAELATPNTYFTTTVAGTLTVVARLLAARSRHRRAFVVCLAVGSRQECHSMISPGLARGAGQARLATRESLAPRWRRWLEPCSRWLLGDGHTASQDERRHPQARTSGEPYRGRHCGRNSLPSRTSAFRRRSPAKPERYTAVCVRPRYSRGKHSL